MAKGQINLTLESGKECMEDAETAKLRSSPAPVCVSLCPEYRKGHDVLMSDWAECEVELSPIE